MSVPGAPTCGGNAMACVFGWARLSKTRRGGSTLVATVVVAALVLLGRVDGAMAACAPASPVNNAPVTCTGTTNDQNSTAGYGTSTDTGNAHHGRAGRQRHRDQFWHHFRYGDRNQFRHDHLGRLRWHRRQHRANVTNSGTISGGSFASSLLHRQRDQFRHYLERRHWHRRQHHRQRDQFRHHHGGQPRHRCRHRQRDQFRHDLIRIRRRHPAQRTSNTFSTVVNNGGGTIQGAVNALVANGNASVDFTNNGTVLGNIVLGPGGGLLKTTQLSSAQSPHRDLQ